MGGLHAAAVQRQVSRKERRKAKKLKKHLVVAGGNSAPQPSGAAALLVEGAAHLQAGLLAPAEIAFRGVLEETPADAQAHLALAETLRRTNRYEQAYKHYKQSADLDPSNYECWRQFGHCLMEMRQYEAASMAYGMAIGRRQDDPRLRLFQARAYVKADELSSAKSAYDKALALDPSFADAHFESGNLQLTLGDSEAARKCYRDALSINPDLLEAHYRLARLGETAGEEDSVLVRLEACQENHKNDANSRALAYFSAAEIHHKAKRFDQAFRHFQSGNSILATRERVDIDKHAAACDALIEAFSAEVFDTVSAGGSSSDVPVFIVGMPRSGTSLVEQILASHPDATGVGEFDQMQKIADALWATQDGELLYPRDVAKIDQSALVELANQYHRHMARQAPRPAQRIADKFVFNFMNLGLIALLFPKAAIIHCDRDPMAIGFSCYRQFFADGKIAALTGDLESLGSYYLQYRRLMAHWREVLPIKLLDVRYEDLIANQEDRTKEIIEFVGLEWDDACLAFHEANHSVRTASVGQVRKPIYSTSVDGWRRYETHLEPLCRVLEADEPVDKVTSESPSSDSIQTDCPGGPDMDVSA